MPANTSYDRWLQAAPAYDAWREVSELIAKGARVGQCSGLTPEA